MIASLIKEEQAKHRKSGNNERRKKCAIVSVNEVFDVYTRPQYLKIKLAVVSLDRATEMLDSRQQENFCLT